MNCCLNCNTKFVNNKEYNKHIKICIFYLYNSQYQKKLNNDLITNIVEMINLFNLHNKNMNSNIYKKNILLELENEYSILNHINIIGYNININSDKKKIEYIYNYIKNSNKEIYNYKEIIEIISKLYYISNNDILNLINAYKISYNNCDF